MTDTVALLAESVDRNPFSARWLAVEHVALLAESVDRNKTPHYIYYEDIRRSPRGERG